jgi:hypothetical protein
MNKLHMKKYVPLIVVSLMIGVLIGAIGVYVVVSQGTNGGISALGSNNQIHRCYNGTTWIS